MSDGIRNIRKAVAELYGKGVSLPAALDQALDQCEASAAQRSALKSQISSYFGKRGGRERGRLARIQKQPKCFRPRLPIQPVIKGPKFADTPEEQYLSDERHAIQSERFGCN